MKKIVIDPRVARVLEERDGVGISAAVVAGELGISKLEALAAIEKLCRELLVIRMDEDGRTTYRWKEGTKFELRCRCGHPWSHHEGTPGTECIAERCNCGLFREDTTETETCDMTNDAEKERDLAMALIDAQLASPKVVVALQNQLGFGRVPAKATEFESGKPAKKERCAAMLTLQKAGCDLLLEEIENREDDRTTRADDPDQTDLEDVLDSPPAEAVIVWHPGTKTVQREVVAVSEIEGSVYLVRHLENDESETLFQGTSWADLVQQVLAKNHKLEPMAQEFDLRKPDPEMEATEPGPQPPVDVADTSPAAVK